MIRAVAANGATRAARRPFPLRQTLHPMKTRFLSAALAAMLIPAVAMAETETIDGVTYTFTVSGGAATITATDTGDAKAVNIPETLGGATITALGNSSFANNTTIQKVFIPETVTRLGTPGTMGGSVFEGCIALTSCNIPSGVTDIPDECFRECSKLRRIVLPAGLKSIGSSAFYGCSSLETINYPEGLTSIGSNAFEKCSSLKEAILPDSVMSLGGLAFYNCSSLVKAHLPSGLKTIPDYVFHGCGKLSEVNIPNGVTSVAFRAFYACSSLREVVVPASVTSVGSSAFSDVQRVVFLGRPPAGIPSAGVSTAVYPKEFGELWAAQIPVSKFGGFVKPDRPAVTIVLAEVRENDPTVLDVVYQVASAKPTVKIRALAFEDGIRSFEKVTRPETFVDNTAPADWDAVEANVEHTLSWKVSADFTTDLAKMKFEILAVEDGILPLELTTVPANGTNKAMEFSWNLLTEAQVFDALLWLYADKTEGLTLENGVLKNGETKLAEGASVYQWSEHRNWDDIGWNYKYYSNAPAFIFERMGFSKLDGESLDYVNRLSRLGLMQSPCQDTAFRQYAYRWIEGE